MLWLIPILGVAALLFAGMQAARVVKEDTGTDRMEEIAQAINEGAHAFLTGRRLSAL